MVKPMRYKAIVALLRDAGFAPRQGKGDHENWSNGPFRVTITQPRDVSPGLVRKVLQTIEASRKDESKR